MPITINGAVGRERLSQNSYSKYSNPFFEMSSPLLLHINQFLLETPFWIFAVLIGSGFFTLVSAFAGSSGVGHSSLGQLLFSFVIALSRVRNVLLFHIDRLRGVYQYPSSCQIPHVHNLHDVLHFIFGYKKTGLFIEVGAYDGESFSNTSGLADLGWNGHYLEPIPKFAKACASRHSWNAPRVKVHQVCAGEKDGDIVTLSTAGPFTSAVQDEIDSLANSKLNSTLKSLGWDHRAEASSSSSLSSTKKRKGSKSLSPSTTGVDLSPSSVSNVNEVTVSAMTITLNSFFKKEGIPSGGAIDLLVVDVEGFELPILKDFHLSLYRPKVAIVEIQEMQKRYKKNERVQSDARALFDLFAKAGYQILYKDMVNTVFVHESVECAGGD